MDIRLYSLAHRGLRSAKGAWIYLADDRGRRFEPTQGSTDVPFDVALQLGESVSTSLTFVVPPDAHGLSFIGGVSGITYASFIIGNGDLMGKPRVRFPVH